MRVNDALTRKVIAMRLNNALVGSRENNNTCSSMWKDETFSIRRDERQGARSRLHHVIREPTMDPAVLIKEVGANLVDLFFHWRWHQPKSRTVGTDICVQNVLQ